MIASGILVSPPVLEDRTDSLGAPFKVMAATVKLQPEGRIASAIILPLWPGASVPFEVGDRVLCAMAYGVAYVLGAYSTHAITALGHVVVQPRGDGVVFLGPLGGTSDNFLMYKRASDEIAELKAQIDAIVTVLAAIPGGASITGTINTRDAAIGPITGGKPSAQVLGRPNDA